MTQICSFQRDGHGRDRHMFIGGHFIILITYWHKKILEYSGQKGFKETIESAGLPSPFQEAVIKELAQSVENSISWELMGAEI